MAYRTDEVNYTIGKRIKTNYSNELIVIEPYSVDTIMTEFNVLECLGSGGGIDLMTFCTRVRIDNRILGIEYCYYDEDGETYRMIRRGELVSAENRKKLELMKKNLRKNKETRICMHGAFCKMCKARKNCSICGQCENCKVCDDRPNCWNCKMCCRVACWQPFPFHNSASVLVGVYDDKLKRDMKINIKLFNTGCISFSGCKSDRSRRLPIVKFIEVLSEYPDLYNGKLVDIESVYHVEIKADMIRAKTRILDTENNKPIKLDLVELMKVINERYVEIFAQPKDGQLKISGIYDRNYPYSIDRVEKLGFGGFERIEEIEAEKYVKIPREEKKKIKKMNKHRADTRIMEAVIYRTGTVIFTKANAFDQINWMWTVIKDIFKYNYKNIVEYSK